MARKNVKPCGRPSRENYDKGHGAGGGGVGSINKHFWMYSIFFFLQFLDLKKTEMVLGTLCICDFRLNSLKISTFTLFSESRYLIFCNSIENPRKKAKIYETPPLCCAALSLKFLPWFPSRSRVHQPGACLGVKEWRNKKNPPFVVFLCGN